MRGAAGADIRVFNLYNAHILRELKLAAVVKRFGYIIKISLSLMFLLYLCQIKMKSVTFYENNVQIYQYNRKIIVQNTHKKHYAIFMR